MQYLLAKMLAATERLINLPMSPYRINRPPENMMTKSIPCCNCSPSLDGHDSDHHEELLNHYQRSSIESKENETLAAADAVNDDIDSYPRSSLFVKEALLSRWILLIGIFGIHETKVSDDDDEDFLNLEDRREIIRHETIDIPLVKSEVQSHLQCDIELIPASDPYRAAVGMVKTAFKERGPLTSSEGAALRDFFSKRGE